jgi:hypothetical protein
MKRYSLQKVVKNLLLDNHRCLKFAVDFRVTTITDTQ